MQDVYFNIIRPMMLVNKLKEKFCDLYCELEEAKVNLTSNYKNILNIHAKINSTLDMEEWARLVNISYELVEEHKKNNISVTEKGKRINELMKVARRIRDRYNIPNYNI